MKTDKAKVTGAYRPLQKRFLDIPQTPLCYWLRPRFFDLLAGRTLGGVASVVQGLATANDPRFVRFVWETPLQEWAKQAISRRWVSFEKGGGYGKWFGHHWWTVDWEKDGARIKHTPGPRVQNEQYYFRKGWTYTQIARGSLGLRSLQGDAIFADKASGVFIVSGRPDHVISLLNTRLSSFILRALSIGTQFREGYVSRAPLPKGCDRQSPFGTMCVQLKQVHVEGDPTERSFSPVAAKPEAILAVDATLHACEGIGERQAARVYGLDNDDIVTAQEETGIPAGWYPLIGGFDEIPPIPEGLSEIPREVEQNLHRHDRLELSAKELADLKAKLRSTYEEGPGATAKVGLQEFENENTHEEEQVALGARIPIPTETFLEELSQKLEIHPISVYWLLKEGIEHDGWRCLPEERRLAAERVTVMILRQLGHQWPTQIEAGEAVPEWADADGIIPLTGGTGEPTLLERLRERITEDYDEDEAGSFERHFSEVSGKPLEQWIETEFFKYQLSLLRKRPIAWQIQSGRYAKKRRPAFACLVYFHKLDGDLIPKIRAQYVGPLRRKWETELRGIEEVPDHSHSDRQDARRVELEEMIAELKDFDERLGEVMNKGFASSLLEELIAKERPDKWCSIDGELTPPADKDAMLLQEGRYLPDINDGVRVNIAPLQKAGLLAAEVIAKKDLDAAIVDRAEWRSDERRWCREGKLPHPGWWKQGAANGS